VWASIEALSAREFIAAQAEDSKVNTRITIRYRSGINAKMRLYHEAKDVYYNIEGVLSDKDSGLEYLTLPCSSGLRYEQGADVAPVNLVLPTIGGTAEVGEVIEASDGQWANDPVSYAYQWYRSPGGAIAGATNSTYLTVLADQGLDLYCTVTATNTAGSASVNTADFGPIAP
jgi:SPP1 family predicted phage head-tail adaptor